MNILQKYFYVCLAQLALGLVSYIHNCAAVHGALDERCHPCLEEWDLPHGHGDQVCLDCTEGQGSTKIKLSNIQGDFV